MVMGPLGHRNGIDLYIAQLPDGLQGALFGAIEALACERQAPGLFGRYFYEGFHAVVDTLLRTKLRI